MAERRRKRKEEEVGGAPSWMVTYGDMMSLLLCFFVLLLSFSTISEEAFKEAMASIQGAMFIFEKHKGLINPVPKPPSRTPKSIERLARELSRRLHLRGMEKDIEIKYDKQGGLKINLPSRILFDTAKAELKAEASPVLNDLAAVLADVPEAFIEVRGHTDSRPLIRSSKYRDNYDLSFARADAVTRHLNRVGRIPLNQFEIIACGPGQSVATNDTEEGMQANRRVEIYVRGEFTESRMEEMRQRIDLLELGIEEEEGARTGPNVAR